MKKSTIIDLNLGNWLLVIQLFLVKFNIQLFEINNFNHSVMQKTSTFLLVVMMTATIPLVAQKSDLNFKLSNHQNLSSHISPPCVKLKAATTMALPTGEANDYWNGSDWNLGETFTYEYNVNNQVVTSISASNSKYLFTYNVAGKLLQKAYQNWNGLQWKNSWREDYFFDSFTGEEVGNSYSTWSGSAFVIQNGHRQVQVYNASNELIEHRDENYDNGTSQWTISWGSKIEEDLNVNNYVTERREYEYKNSAWELKRITQYLYDGSNKVTEEIQIGKQRTVYEYDVSNKLIVGYVYEWDNVNTVFNLMGRYNNVAWASWNPALGLDNPISTYTIQMYDGITLPITDDLGYADAEKYDATYTSTGYTGITSSWDATTSSWLPSSKNENDNPSYGNESRYEYDYDTNTSNWIYKRVDVKVNTAS